MDPDLERHALARAIAARLREQREPLQRAWRAARPFAHAALDDTLPAATTRTIAGRFPPLDAGDGAGLLLRDTLRERKRVGVALDRYDPALREILYAFQQPEVLREVEALTGIAGLEPDPTLYASGISAMARGDFLNPHLDNSHDGDGRRYRAINVLFYVTPDWGDDDGGHLELWEPGPRAPHTVHARFNRTVVMGTSQHSWHSVSRVTREGVRMCVSNYYFTHDPPGGVAYRHVTSFAGRPEEPWKRAWLRVDRAVLNAAGRAFPWLLRRSKHRLPGG